MVGIPVVLGSGDSVAPVQDTEITDAFAVELDRAAAEDTLVFMSVNVMRFDGPVTTPEVSGGGLTWVLHDSAVQYRTAGNSTASLFVFRGIGAAPSGTPITITPGEGYLVALADVIEVPNTLMSGTVAADAIVQTVSAIGGSDLSAQAATATDTVNNAFIVFGAYNRSTTTRTVTPTLTELTDASGQNAGARAAGLASQYAIGLSDADPTIAFDHSASVDAAGLMILEIAASATATPLDAGSITATPGNEEIVIAEGTAPSGGTESYTRDLYRSTDGSRGTLLAGDVTLPYTDETATDPGTTYSYTQEVDDGEGTDDSEQVSASPLAALPSAPSGCAAAALSAGTNRVTWTDNASDETAFVVERAPDESGSPGTYVELSSAVAADAEQYDDSTATPGTAYWYRVKARNAGGDSTYSTAASAVTTLGVTALTGEAAGTSSDTATAGLAISISGEATGASTDAGTLTLLYSVSGTVTLDAVAVEGALVYLIDQSTDAVVATETTDASGEYEFTSVAAGTYHVVCEYAGHSAPSVSGVVIGG